MYNELVKRLREDAEWAEANEWETPITLSDNLKQAADAIEELSMRLHGDEAAIAGMKREIERMVVADKPRWIPVTERLPDMHMVHSEYGCGDYMISDAVAIYAIDLGETPEVFCGMYEKDLGEDGFEGWTDCEGNPFNTVTHWMPLPEPPKEE